MVHEHQGVYNKTTWVGKSARISECRGGRKCAELESESRGQNAPSATCNV